MIIRRVALVLSIGFAEARAQTMRASVDDSGAQGDGDPERIAISATGRFVVFSSFADDLVANDTNGH